MVEARAFERGEVKNDPQFQFLMCGLSKQTTVLTFDSICVVGIWKCPHKTSKFAFLSYQKCPHENHFNTLFIDRCRWMAKFDLT